MAATRVPFGGQYANAHDLVILMASRGLLISNQVKAERYLKMIGYFRLSAYLYPLLRNPKSQKLFKQGASFQQMMMLYRFDKKLRLLMFNEIEKIEVAVRSAIVDTVCELTGDRFWITNPVHFSNASKFSNTMRLIDKELRGSHEEFIADFKSSYSDLYPPCWILAEILPFGYVTNIFCNLKDKRLKKKVSQQFGLQVPPFESWMTKLYVMRNACAHHSRVWNKQNAMRVTIPNRFTRPWITLATNPYRVYFDLCIIKYLLDVVSPGNDMLTKLRWLMVDFPEIDLRAMGFPEGWELEPLWR